MATSLFSPEPAFATQTGGNFLLLKNGLTIRLVNSNRNNRKSRIVLSMFLLGSVKLKLYRGYKDSNGNLQYNLSNDVLVSSAHKFYPTTVYFNDLTLEDKNYINYYIEVEGLSDGELFPYQCGLYFSEITATSNHEISTGTALRKDINSKPLSRQEYSKTVQFVLTANRYELGAIINLIEKPFRLSNELDACIDNSTRSLSLNNINTSYVNSYSQYLDVTINATETI
ncbi:MAG: hypothetical protein GY928_37470 [Colwellia sp.]|nr:hypothetical protein [Colwellia sp.]